MDKINGVPLEKTTVKQLKESELAKVVPVYLDAFRGMKNPKLVKQWLRCNFRAFPQKMCFGAWHDDSLLGYIVWAEKGTFRSEAVWELEQIAVLSEYRGQGIGEKLIRDSLSKIEVNLKKRQDTLKLIKVTTGVSNKSARLYEKVLGAKQECVIKDFYNGDEQIMIARLKQGNTSLSSDDKILLRLEYQECQAGYNNRDKMVPDEVRNVGILFSVLTAALVLGINLAHASQVWFWTIVVVVGLFGLFALLGLLIDIESNLSCKKALRQKSKEIEGLLSPEKGVVNSNPPLSMWRHTLTEREKYKSWEEKNLKEFLSKGLPEGESNYFVWGVRFSIILWVALVVLGAIFGPQLLSN